MKRLWVSLALVMMLVAGGWTPSASAKDFGQCERRCREEFGEGVKAKKLSKEKCECFRDRKSLGKITRLYPFDPPQMGPEVCGINGKTYLNKEAAELETTVLHGGACGQCSNEHDIGVYWATAQTMTKTARNCATLYTIVGEAAARKCFEKVDLTPGCNDCWIDNMGCTAAHCFGVCVLSQIKGDPNAVDGKLNDCLACDEAHCGGPFIRCAGANRRRAGIPSDIPRPDDDIWPKFQ